VALAVLAHREDAEDVCQDAWLRALERIEDCRKPDRFVYWLLQIVRNRARNRRGHRKVRRADPLEPDSPIADPHDDRGRRDLAIRLEEALAEVSEIQRTVLLLHDLEGWDHRGIAAALGISEVMSRQHLFQARRRLRERLDKEQRSTGP
jgi:RNA polymerase sigma-70 factor (ECF subfamily)